MKKTQRAEPRLSHLVPDSSRLMHQGMRLERLLAEVRERRDVPIELQEFIELGLPALLRAVGLLAREDIYREQPRLLPGAQRRTDFVGSGNELLALCCLRPIPVGVRADAPHDFREHVLGALEGRLELLCLADEVVLDLLDRCLVYRYVRNPKTVLTCFDNY